VTRLRDRQDDLEALIASASESLVLPGAWVEKDFWVVEILRSVFRDPPEGVVPIFKGGTSLSKAFGLVQRFSEDVDILVEMPEEFGEGRRDRAMKDICNRCEDDLGIETSHVRSGRGEHRAVRFTYPQRQGGGGGLAAGVLLEIGRRGGYVPRTGKTIESYIRTHLQRQGDPLPDFEELEPVATTVLNPERTVLEKLALLHTQSVNYVADGGPDSERALASAARHVYDVSETLEDATVREALTPRGTAARLAADIHEKSEASGWPSEPRPDEGYGSSPAFQADASAYAVLDRGYEETKQLIWGPVPKLEECVAVIIQHSELL
jgi:hypothetical protein